MSFFRKRFLYSYLCIALLFTFLLYIYVPKTLLWIQKRYLIQTTKLLVEDLKKTDSLPDLIQKLKTQQPFLFVRVSLVNFSQLLFDTHRRLVEENKAERHILNSTEVKAALQHSYGVAQRFSKLFGQQMIYCAYAFEFQEQTLILRLAFPLSQIVSLTQELTLILWCCAMAFLTLAGVCTGLIWDKYTKPIQSIIKTMTAYQLGREEEFPEINLEKDGVEDEANQLSRVFNSLVRRLKSEIDVLIAEKNDTVTILDSLMEGIIAFDEQGFMMYMNQIAQLFLEEHGEIGKKFPKEVYPECYEVLKKALQGEMAQTTLLPKKMPRIYWDIIAVPKKGKGAILVLQDKTVLHKLVDVGKDFVANASHELKTPLTIMKGFAETLHDYPQLSKKMFHDITLKIMSNCERMETLIQNLLTLSTLDEGLPLSRLKKCFLLNIVQEAKKIVMAAYPTAQIFIDCRVDEPIVWGDEDLLLQACINVLDNGAKYSQGHPVIKVFLTQDSNYYRIAMTDHGIGISLEEQERIFERFYAVDKSRSRSLGGCGLGLSILQNIMDRHKGRVEVKSALGEGSTFTLILPVMDEEHEKN